MGALEERVERAELGLEVDRRPVEGDEFTGLLALEIGDREEVPRPRHELRELGVALDVEIRAAQIVRRHRLGNLGKIH